MLNTKSTLVFLILYCTFYYNHSYVFTQVLPARGDELLAGDVSAHASARGRLHATPQPHCDATRPLGRLRMLQSIQ